MKENPYQGFQSGRLLERELRENRPAPPVRGRHYIGVSHRTTDVPGERSDRRVVRLGRHALRAATLPVRDIAKLIDHRNCAFPADFIAEGVDQTRGWFFTPTRHRDHGCSTPWPSRTSSPTGWYWMPRAIKCPNGSGNAVDPFDYDRATYGSDPLRWYMITNSQPWDNLKFDMAGVDEVKRKFFGTLYNTYGFFALYANVDQFTLCRGRSSAIERDDPRSIVGYCLY